MFELLNAAELAHLSAKSAAYAHGLVNHCLAVYHGDAGATDLHAHLAAYALVSVYLYCGTALCSLEKSTRTAADDNGCHGSCYFFLDNAFKFGKICGVNCADVIAGYAERCADIFKAKVRSGIAHESLTCEGVLLVTCHTCDAVVENDVCCVATVVYHVHKSCKTAVHECGVTDYGNVLVSLTANCCCAVEGGDGCAHAVNGVNCGKRSNCAESVASDVTGNTELQLGESVEHTSVRTTGAKYRRTGRDGRADFAVVRLDAEETCAEKLFGIFVAEGKNTVSLADYVNAKCTAVIFDNGIKFFNNDDCFMLCSEVKDQLLRQGIDKTEL